MKYLFLFLGLQLQLWTHPEICFFVPPKNWTIDHPRQTRPSVHISFSGENKKGLAPSINLATEVVTVSLEEYVNEVKKLHIVNPNCRWRDLGPFTTHWGTGRLSELESPTKQGTARLMQWMVLKNGVVYTLTTAALKEEFSKYYKLFDQAFRSFQFSSNLIQSYPDLSKQRELQQLVDCLERQFLLIIKEEKNVEAILNGEFFQAFKSKVINHFTEMGPYWQILFIKDIYTKLLTRGVI